MTEKVTDLKSYRFGKAVDSYIGSVGSIYQSEQDFFRTGKFLPFADSYIDSGWDEEYRPAFHILVDFRHYKPSEEAEALLRRLKSDRFEIIKQKFGREYRAEIRRKPLDAPGCYGPHASAEVTFEEARGIFSVREEGKLGAYQPSRGGFRTTCQENWDDRGVGFRIVVCGHDARRNRFEEHIVDNQSDMDEIVSMMSRIHASKSMTNDASVVTFRR